VHLLFLLNHLQEVFTIPPKEALYFIVAGSSADYGDYVLMHL
jgi:hypothetical protein